MQNMDILKVKTILQAPGVLYYSITFFHTLVRIHSDNIPICFSALISLDWNPSSLAAAKKALVSLGDVLLSDTVIGPMLP